MLKPNFLGRDSYKALSHLKLESDYLERSFEVLNLFLRASEVLCLELFCIYHACLVSTCYLFSPLPQQGNTYFTSIPLECDKFWYLHIGNVEDVMDGGSHWQGKSANLGS